MEASPLILTLALNEEAFSFFNLLRQKYFPAERNFLKAHLTLFHHLPPNEKIVEEAILSCASLQPIFSLPVVDVVSIGKGVAYKLESLPLQQLHKTLQEKWRHFLTPQDGQKLWPHVTVQNKVAPAIAKETLAELKFSFKPFTAYGLGLSVWRYEGGPWTFIKTYPFKTGSGFTEQG